MIRKAIQHQGQFNIIHHASWLKLDIRKKKLQIISISTILKS